MEGNAGNVQSEEEGLEVSNALRRFHVEPANSQPPNTQNYPMV